MPVWGPTLVMRKGDTVTVDVTNGLADDTTTHWHVVHLPPEMDGGPHQVIAPGANWSPTWTVNNNGATYWHHPHAHELTWTQPDMGAGGFIIVRDDEEGGKDNFSIRVDESVTFVATCDDSASDTHPFTYHCHMANHEDEGLMGQSLVVDGR